MSQVFHSIVQMQAPFNMIVLVVIFGSFATVVTTIVTQLRKYASHRQELEFKRDLVERGMAAEEIERVVRARGAKMGCD